MTFNADLASDESDAVTYDIALSLGQFVSETQTEYPYIAAVQGYWNEGTGEIGDCSSKSVFPTALSASGARLTKILATSTSV